MPKIGDIVEHLERFAPIALAEDWDNVGLLVGDPLWDAARVMACLTVTPTSAAEAIERGANLIVTHHPLPFHAIQSITTNTTTGKLLLDLIAARVAVYSPHTAFDSAPAGINQHLAIGLGLQQIEALIPTDDANDDANDSEVGSGRIGTLGEQIPLCEMTERLKTFLGISTARVVGAVGQTVSRVAIACGSGGGFLSEAVAQRCDCMVTGETTFHTCLEAEAQGVALIMPGHFSSERFAMLSLADYLNEQVSGIEVWASEQGRQERQGNSKRNSVVDSCKILALALLASLAVFTLSSSLSNSSTV